MENTLWFTRNAYVYYTLLVLIWSALLYYSYRIATSKTLPTVPIPLFVASLLGAFVLFRLPILTHNIQIDPDESQMLAGVLTLLEDPVFWRSCDANTIGPLDLYAVYFAAKLGLPVDYTTARIVGAICIAGSLGLFFFAVNHFFNRTTAVYAGVCTGLFWAVIPYSGFVHYSSEHVPILCISVCLWGVSRIYNQTDTNASLFSTGCAAMLTPFGKLQGVPIVGLLILLAYGLLYYRYARPLSKWLWLTLGGVATLAVAVVLMGLNDVLDDFWTFYILDNLVYINKLSWVDKFMFWRKGLSGMLDADKYFAGCATMIGIFLMTKSLGKSRQPRILVGLVLLFGAASFYSVLTPGKDFPHYTLLLIFPIGLLNALLFDSIRQQTMAHARSLTWVMVVIFGGSGLAYLGRTLSAPLRQKSVNYYPTTPFRVSKAAQVIKQYAQPGDPVTVWGWACELNVESQTAQGTQESHTYRCFPNFDKYVSNNVLYGAHRRRYLSDLQRNRPVVFVDAVGIESFAMNDRRLHGHEAIPELSRYVADHYTFVHEEPQRARIYVRNDLVKRSENPIQPPN